MSNGEDDPQGGKRKLQIEFLRIPTNNGVPFMRVSTFCVGVKQSAQETTSFPDIIFPANKNVLLGRREHTDRIVNAFYLKSNQAHPSNKKCVGYQFIFILFNVRLVIVLLRRSVRLLYYITMDGFVACH